MAIMIVIPALVTSYATAVYLQGTRRLTARDGISGIPASYYIPVEQHAASTYSLTDIDYALAQGWINQTEYGETVAYIV